MENNIIAEQALEELIRSFNFMLQETLKNTTTQIYDGIIISNNNDGRWNVQYNGEVHPTKPNKLANPSVGQMVTVYIPQGNVSKSFFI